MKKKYFSIKQGFTLIELLVVISIMVVLSLGAFYGLNPGGSESRVETAAKLLARDIERTRDLSLNRVIDPTCETLYSSNPSRICSQYSILFHAPHTNEYSILPKEATSDLNVDFEKFAGSTEILPKGTKIISPENQEIIHFTYIPDGSIRLETKYTAGNCDDPQKTLGTITLADDDEQYFVDVIFYCNGMITTQKR